MGYNIHDLKNAADSVHASLEARSRQRGEELAGRFLGWFSNRSDARAQITKEEARSDKKDVGRGWGSNGW